MKLDTTAFWSWCAAKSIHTCLDIRQDATDGSRYTVLREQPTADNTSNKNHHVNLLQVPLQACITADTSEELADRLLWETQHLETSDYAPYLHLLITHCQLSQFQESLPRFWSPQRLDSVTDGGWLQRALERDALRTNHYYNSASSKQQPQQNHQVDPRRAWALAVVDTRSHFLPDGRYILTPVLDMINHDPTVQETTLRVVVVEDVANDEKPAQQQSVSSSQEDDHHHRALCLDIHKDSLVVATTSPTGPSASTASSLSWMDQFSTWKKGARGAAPAAATTTRKRPNEVCISYGDFTNLHTLMQYGFVASSNNQAHNTESVFIRTIRGVAATVTVRQGSICSSSSSSDDALARLRQALDNDEDVYALVAGELQVAADQAGEGAARTSANDALVATYLEQRRATLEEALAKIRLDFPQVF